MSRLFIINLYNNSIYTSCEEQDAQENLVAARKAYEEELELVKSHKQNFPKNASYWQGRIDTCLAILAAGFLAVTFEMYVAKEKERFLDKEPMEITEKEFYDALDCLPPLRWIQNDKYSMFFCSEPNSLTFHAQYIRINETCKCYTAITDILDRKTWIDKLLKL